jgi:putative ABC transport system permease protein
MKPETLLQDIRFGWRLLRRAPGFTAAAVLTLGLGTGVTTAVFSVLDQVVLRPLPYPEPERLTMLWETISRDRFPTSLSPVNFGDYRSLAQVFEDAAAWWYPQVDLTAPDREPLRVRAVEASANFFQVIGVQTAIGAGFPPAPLYDRDLVAVISHRLWRDRFGSDPDVWQRLTWDLAQHSRGAHFMEWRFPRVFCRRAGRRLPASPLVCVPSSGCSIVSG